MGARTGKTENRSLAPLLIPLIAISVFIIDQIAKLLIRINVPVGTNIFSGMISITHTENSGVAFSLLQGQQWLSIVFSFVAIIVIIFFWRHFESVLKKIGVGLLLGGILGNLVDRVFIGTVTDFIDFHFWPVFNIADSCIVIGVIILVYALWKE